MDEKEKKEQEQRTIKEIYEEINRDYKEQDCQFPWFLTILTIALLGSPLYGYSPAPLTEKEQIAFLKGKVEAYEKELG